MPLQDANATPSFGGLGLRSSPDREWRRRTMAAIARKKSARQTPVGLPVQPIFQGSDERMQQIGNLLPLLPPGPVLQHKETPLPVNGVLIIPFHQKGSFYVPFFLYNLSNLYQTPG